MVLLLLAFGLSPLYPGHGENLWARVLGCSLLGVGGWFLAAGFGALGRQLTPFPKPRADGQMIHSGVYGWVRHPIYTGVLAGVLGWALCWTSGPGLIVALFCAPFFDAKARREERWLKQKYPGYEDYSRRVRRFVPFIY